MVRLERDVRPARPGRLAEAVAEALKMDLITWNVKSTTRAQEGLYHYDTVQRLYDSRFGDHDVRDIREYIKLGPVGQAFKSPERVVLLIDEIDKADIEFPNDLLNELDRMYFDIPETGERVAAVQRPVVIITSNAEKELPDAFLRRCIFHFIDFPDRELMQRIVDVHHPGLDQGLMDSSLSAFFAIRGMDRVRKPPSTSELVDWILARQPIKRALYLTHGEETAMNALAADLEKRGIGKDRIISPVLDDEVELSGGKAGPRFRPAPRRLNPELVGHPDWHNELAQTSLDIRAALEGAADDRSRSIILRRIRRALEGKE